MIKESSSWNGRLKNSGVARLLVGGGVVWVAYLHCYQNYVVGYF